jgi:hypothetical protein
MSQQIMIAPGRFVDSVTASEIQNLAAKAKCSPAELVAACDALASPARALAAQLRVTESRAESIINVINTQAGKLSSMKAIIAKSKRR